MRLSILRATVCGLRPPRPLRLLLPAAMALMTFIGLAVSVPAEAATSGVPFGHYDSVASTATGVRVVGWAIDPDTIHSIPVTISADGHTLATVTASVKRADVARQYGKFGARHGFAATYVLGSGAHTVCATARNVGKAGASKSLGCRSVNVVIDPVGHVAPITKRTRTTITVTGWAADPQATGASSVKIAIDAAAPVTVLANQVVPGLKPSFTGMSTAHGFSHTFTVSTRAHQVSVVALNVGLGADAKLATLTAPAAGATVPSPPPAPAAHAGKASASLTWQAPKSTGGSPLTGYVVVATPGGASIAVGASATSALVPGLVAGRSYTFTVAAKNVVGVSAASAPSAAVRPTAATAPKFGNVTTPALISTSRYIRNITGGSGDAAKTRAMGAADGAANPANHRYLALLQIGGQTSTGVILSATSRYVSYARTESALQSYIAGYASTQHANAPATIAIGTNNDINVSSATGAIWARQLVNPLASYAKRYPNITIAGANDIEPGFIGTPAASMNWVRAFLAATTAKFVFNGSTDGCSATLAHSTCNNGWHARTFVWLAGALAPTRILALPQIYNTSMAAEWRLISVTGVENLHKKLNFAGPLTEYSACVIQSGGCASLPNNRAWSALWTQLQSDSRIKQASLPYGTDLRID